jgi:hypothetical protein
MPRLAKAKPAGQSPLSPPPVEESRAALAAAAHLHAVAEGRRGRAQTPDFQAYLRAGRGPAYQRDYETWSQHASVACAFEYAAHQLDEALIKLNGKLSR